MTPTATYIAEENCLQEESQVENSKMRKALEGIAYFTSVDLNWMKQTAVEALK